MQTFNTSKTILVVDQYEPVCQLIQLLLVEAGYDVHVSTTGRGAVKLAQAVPQIHVTVCGVGLQDMPAEECVEECAKCHPDSAILFISGSAEMIASALPYTILYKPFTINELCTAVRSALRPALRIPYEQAEGVLILQ